MIRLDVHCRAETRPGDRIGGYASVFGVTADLTSFGKERIAPGAFDAVLRDDTSDTRALWNHDVQKVLGRQAAGTLRLSTDTTGLEYEIDLPNTSYARDLRELVERGDVDGASFGFIPNLTEWADDRSVLVHTSVRRLIDVSPVTFPAYAGANVEARSRPDHPGSRRSQLIRARARITLRGSYRDN